MELAPGLHSLHVPIEDGSFFFRHYPPNSYLLTHGEGALIDTGTGDDDSVSNRLDQLRELGSPDFRYIILTHPHVDHLGGAEALQKLTGARVLIHRDDADTANDEFENTHIDDILNDGDVIDLGGLELEMIHTPGHTHGHTCVLNRTDRSLFTGDHILGTGTTAVSPDRGDMAKYIDSLRKLQPLDVSILYPGHGSPVNRPHAKFKELLDHRLEREKQVLTFLSEGRNTIESLVKAIYPELDQDLLSEAEGQVEVHLVKLINEGRVESHGKTYTLK